MKKLRPRDTQSQVSIPVSSPFCYSLFKWSFREMHPSCSECSVLWVWLRSGRFHIGWVLFIVRRWLCDFRQLCFTSWMRSWQSPGPLDTAECWQMGDMERVLVGSRGYFRPKAKGYTVIPEAAAFHVPHLLELHACLFWSWLVLYFTWCAMSTCREFVLFIIKAKLEIHFSAV